MQKKTIIDLILSCLFNTNYYFQWKLCIFKSLHCLVPEMVTTVLRVSFSVRWCFKYIIVCVILLIAVFFLLFLVWSSYGFRQSSSRYYSRIHPESPNGLF